MPETSTPISTIDVSPCSASDPFIAVFPEPTATNICGLMSVEDTPVPVTNWVLITKEPDKSDASMSVETSYTATEP